MTMTNRWFMRAAGLMTTMMLGGWSGCTVVTVEVSTQGEEDSAEGGSADSQGSAEASGGILTTSGTTSGYEPGDSDFGTESTDGGPGDSDFGTESTDGGPGDSDFGTGETGQAPDDGGTQGSTGSSSSGAGNDSEGSSG